MIKIKWQSVALFTRAWIEIDYPTHNGIDLVRSPSSRGRGLKSHGTMFTKGDKVVALFTRAWIEIKLDVAIALRNGRRPLHEGVD